MNKDNINKQNPDNLQDEISEAIASDFKSLSNTISTVDVPIDKFLSNEKDTIFSNVESIFYDVIVDKNNNFSSVKINHQGFISVINEFGVYKYNLKADFIFVIIKNGIIDEISTTDIQDLFINYIKSLPEELEHPKSNFKKEWIENLVFEKNTAIFTKPKLSLLPTAIIDLNKDTKDKAFFYYRNGFVECTPNGYKLQDYKLLKGLIWKSQIIDRDFVNLNYCNIDQKLIDSVIVAKFYYLIANKNFERLSSLCSFSGYLMHNYFETDLKALILTDSKISDIAEGRTGKGLYVLTLSHVRNIVSIDGKSFDSKYAHKYQTINLSTQIVHIEDTKKEFNIEDLFNVIVSGYDVQQKAKDPYKVPAKTVLSCNKTINIQGSSAKGRTIEFELSEYFSDTHTPEMEFKHRFFTDWPKIKEWENYDNFIMFCMCHYLKNGLIAAEQINLTKRKLIDHTCDEFAEWIEDKKLELDYEYEKKDLHSSFLSEYEDLTNDKRKNQIRFFLKCISTWCNLYNFKTQVRKSNGKNLIKFLKKS